MLKSPTFPSASLEYSLNFFELLESIKKKKDMAFLDFHLVSPISTFFHTFCPREDNWSIRCSAAGTSSMVHGFHNCGTKVRPCAGNP